MLSSCIIAQVKQWKKQIPVLPLASLVVRTSFLDEEQDWNYKVQRMRIQLKNSQFLLNTLQSLHCNWCPRRNGTNKKSFSNTIVKCKFCQHRPNLRWHAKSYENRWCGMSGWFSKCSILTDEHHNFESLKYYSWKPHIFITINPQQTIMRSSGYHYWR